MNEKKRTENLSLDKTVKEIVNQPYSKTDPNGSYTGKPVDKYAVPIQDADDL